MNYALVLIILFNPPPCDDLPASFESYNQAISIVRKATFKIEEGVTTYKSSWIKRIEYYSCDGDKGYLIMTLKSSKEYIHKGLPIEVWKKFKVAESYGSFYNGKIKGRPWYSVGNGEQNSRRPV